MDFLGLFHTASGLAALSSGFGVVIQRKGTARHRVLGWVYVGSMLALNATALLLYRLTGGFNFFHAAALASLGTLLLGMWPTRTRPFLGSSLFKHAYFMSGSYVGVLGATAAEIATRAFPSHFAAAAIASSGVALVAGIIIVLRTVPKTAHRVERHPRVDMPHSN